MPVSAGANLLDSSLKDVPDTRSAYAERVTTGYFLDFDIKREKIARYWLSVDDAQEIVQTAVGGMNTTTTVQFFLDNYW